jgi:two-component system, OmpR family, phosphate regulon sensor histidine kinase PhoR
MRSIRMKLFLTYAALALLTVIILGSGFTWYVRVFYLDTVRQRLVEEARITAELIKTIADGLTGIDSGAAGIDSYLSELGLKTSARITLVAPDGTVLGDSHEERGAMDNHLMRPEIKEAGEGVAGSATRFSRTLNQEMLYVAVAIDGDGSITGYVRLALPLSDLNLTVKRVRYALLAGLAGVLALTLALSLMLSGSLTKPLEQMAGVAERISGGDLSSRISRNRNDELGELGKAINSMAESLERKVSEISAGRDRLDAILSTMIDGILLFDADGKAVMANPAAEELFGLSPQGWLGRRDLEIVRNAELHEKMKAVRHERLVQEHRLSLLFPEKRELIVSLVPVMAAGRDKSGVLAVFHDITRLRHLEKMRADFSANVSHELRTPLTAIRGFAETIHDSAFDDSDSTKRFAKIIQREAERLGSLIEDVLTLSQIESGKVEINFVPLDARELIEQVMGMMTGRLGNHQLDMAVDEGLPLMYGDRSLLCQALVNLLDNALKYTPAGGRIVVGAGREGESVRLYVKDNGIGIPENAKDRIFERFYRVDRARSRRLGGTGLGLSIVKHIVEAHHGRLSLESYEGKGTEVAIIINAYIVK